MAESPLTAVSTAKATTAMAAAAEHDMQAAEPTNAPAPAAAALAATPPADEHAGVSPPSETSKLTDEELAQRTRQLISTADMKVLCTISDLAKFSLPAAGFSVSDHLR